MSENKGVKSECKKFGENSRKTASVSTICDEYCRNRDIKIVDNFVNNSQVKLLINVKIRAKIMELLKSFFLVSNLKVLSFSSDF